MSSRQRLDVFLAATPGLETVLLEEARELGFADAVAEPGGVSTRGDWPDVWRANLSLRCCGRVLVRVGSFHAVHLAQLDRKARRLPWESVLTAGSAFRVNATSRNSRIWHGGAAAERIARAAGEATGARLANDAAVRILVRIEDDLCVVSLDTSGDPLHRRGSKQDVGKAPLRETMAAAFLRACGFRGREPVVDPVCGSGTFVLEAAETAAGLLPGRNRRFAFEPLATFDAEAWRDLRASLGEAAHETNLRFHGYDRDEGVVEASRANAARAGVSGITEFGRRTVGAFAPPPDATGPGLVMANPPYGERIGDADDLRALYGALGRTLRERFPGWRLGLVTSEPRLAAATGLTFADAGPPVPHGPLKVKLYRTDPLP